jgi:isopentenyldiphosphate isomerase
MTNIVFVDENDNIIGAGTKQEAWTKGIRHRIARVFLFNAKGELLIQKRAHTLSSLPDRWDHSASGHVDEGETYAEAAQREMEEEVGVRGVNLEEVGKIKTEDVDEPDRIKNRFSMIYRGTYDGPVNFDPEAVSETRWIDPEELLKWMKERPDDFTEGFMLTFKELRRKEGSSV